MNAFVRQLAVLSVLWSLCELLLPEGKQQKMVRMTVSVLVMAALLTALGNMLGRAELLVMDAPAFADVEAAEGVYAQTALRALANQAEGLCVRLAQRAGYRATAAVYLRPDGALERVELSVGDWLREEVPPLLRPDEVASQIAEQLGVEAERVWLTTPTDGAMDQ